MDAADIREMKLEDIEDELDDAREELMKLRFQYTTGELTDHNLMKYTRKNIARLLTIKQERQLAGETEGKE